MNVDGRLNAARDDRSATLPRTAVLVVEDNPGDFVLVQRALAEGDDVERFEVRGAETLAQGTAAARATRPDVVLLDLDLPDSKGLAGLHALLAVAPGIPVVVLTGNDDEALGRRALRQGAQDYLLKDEVRPSHLHRALRYAVSRQAMTEALRESEARFHSLFAEASVPLRCLARDGTIMEVNRAFAELTGYPMPRLLSMNVLALAHPEDRAAELGVLRTLVDDGSAPAAGPLVYEQRIVRADGDVRHVQVSATAVRDPSGSPAYTSAVVNDVTERVLAEAEVAFQARLLDAVGQAVTACDVGHRLRYWNRAAAECFGLTDADRGTDMRTATGIVLPQDAYQGRTWTGEVAVRTAEGEAIDVLLTRTPLRGADDRVEALLDVTTDLSDHKRAQRALEASEERFRSLVHGVSDVISLHEADGTVAYISPSGPRLLALDATQPIDDLWSFVHPEDAPRLGDSFTAWKSGHSRPVQYRLQRADGEWVHCESVGVNLLENPAVAGVVVTTRDISERKKAMDDLAYQAMHDCLTGLPNRSLFHDRLSQALARRERSRSSVAVLFLDLDNFKFVNDSYGHQAGDRMLVAVAGLLQSTCRPGDTVARLGGDEFAVICEEAGDIGCARTLADRLAASLRSAVGIGEHVVHVATSIGIAFAGPDDDATADDLLRDADVALYRAKDRGRSRTEVFDDELRGRALRRMELEEALRQALDAGQLAVHYQPQVELGAGDIVGFEALLRWHHPQLGDVAPSEFVPIAESTGLIRPIGRWVLDQAASQLAAWRLAHPDRPITVAINLSALQLADEELVGTVQEAIARHRLDPASLCLEITESVVMDDASASVQTLRRLKSLGVRLAIDDFGTGYSSLAYLKRFPVDYLKVDRVFVAGLGRDPEDTVIVASVIDLASRLGLDVVAEGVETECQLRELAALGCTYAQGYLWSAPCAAEEASRHIGGTALLPGAVDDVAPRPGDQPHGSGGIDEIVSALAHELRTPITVIRGFAETLGELIEVGHVDVLQQALEAIRRQTDGMESVIASLGDVRTIDNGSLHLDTAVVSLTGVVHDIVADLQVAARDHELVLATDADTLVCVDVNRLRQIVANLVTNAVDHSPPGAPVRVWTGAVGDGGAIRVSDSGPGIPAHRVGELFRKFSRLDRSRKGTGLGLYLARSLARAHGGDVRYRRADGGGADFVITLPSADSDGRQASPSSPLPGRGRLGLRG